MNASFIKGIGMKIHRSSKCYFDKWLTQKKIQEIKDILKEYSNACNYFVKNYEDSVCSMTKFDLTNSKYIQKYIKETGSFLTARLIKDAFNEAYGAVKSAKSISKNRKDNKYFSPKFYGKRIVISQCCNTFEASNSTKIFDINLTLKSFRTDKNKGYKISIPLKKHAQFNKWNNIGTIAKTVTVTDKYVKFSFKIETGEKKHTGTLVEIDFGLKKLCTVSNKHIIGNNIENHLRELQRKKRCSNGYYRKKEEIREYINREIKNINFGDKQLIVVENLKNMKYKMKERGRLSKNIRSVFYNLSYRQVLSRIQMLCEENRVSFRSVLPYYTSQECSSCGHVEKGNRLSQESFVCLKCGFSDNADLNASKVILKRFTMGTYGSHYKQAYLDETTKVSISL